MPRKLFITSTERWFGYLWGWSLQTLSPDPVYWLVFAETLLTKLIVNRIPSEHRWCYHFVIVRVNVRTIKTIYKIRNSVRLPLLCFYTLCRRPCYSQRSILPQARASKEIVNRKGITSLMWHNSRVF